MGKTLHHAIAIVNGMPVVRHTKCSTEVLTELPLFEQRVWGLRIQLLGLLLAEIEKKFQNETESIYLQLMKPFSMLLH